MVTFFRLEQLQAMIISCHSKKKAHDSFLNILNTTWQLKKIIKRIIVVQSRNIHEP